MQPTERSDLLAMLIYLLPAAFGEQSSCLTLTVIGLYHFRFFEQAVSYACCLVCKSCQHQVQQC